MLQEHEEDLKMNNIEYRDFAAVVPGTSKRKMAMRILRVIGRFLDQVLR